MVDASKELDYLVENGFGDVVVVSPSNEKMSLRDYVRGAKWSSGREHRPILCSVECDVGTTPVLLWAQDIYQNLMSNVNLGDKSGQDTSGVAHEVVEAFARGRESGTMLSVKVNYYDTELTFTEKDTPYTIQDALQKVPMPDYMR